MKKSLGITLTIGVAALLLVGCGQQHEAGEHSTKSSTSQTSTKAPSNYLAHVKAQGLALSHQAPIAADDLPNGATAGVSFHGASDVAMQLLVFGTQAQANAAPKAAVGRQQRAYTQNKLLLLADHGLGRGWFEKYQHAIFRQ